MKRIRKILKGIFFTFLALAAIFSFLYMYTSGRWHVAQTVAQDSTIAHISVDNVVFHAESFGSDSAQTVIVVHGGPGQDYRYLLPLKALADQYRVVFYDQRGTGLSPRVDASELTLQSSIEDLNRIVNYYSPDRKVNIIGHSWGAMLASAYLGVHPDKVHKIVLAEPGFLNAEMAAEFMERTNGFAIDMSFGNMLFIAKTVLQSMHLRGPDDQAIRDYIYTGLVQAPISDHPMSGYFCDNQLDTAKMPVWRMSMVASQAIQQSGMDQEGNMNIDLIKGVGNYEDTVLFVSGECNTLIGPDYQRRQASYFPKHRFEVISNAGHFMFADQPEVFFTLIRAYFQQQ
ncbi:MAG: alpha/beta hydrolase [Cyclobacteriaceae bacterium]|nr:alpha/beta hydrolase [Cyclobacteriaceae bacterium]